MARILFVDPVGVPVEEEFKAYLNKAKGKETELAFQSLKEGPEHLEYRLYEALILPELLGIIARAEDDGFEGTIIGCFYDPGLTEAREILKEMAVTAPCESSLLLASSLGHKFSILVGRRKWIPQVEENILKYGLERRLASIRAIGLGVLDFHRDPDATQNLLVREGEKAIKEDGAEVLILGCTAQYGFYSKLQNILGVPVIDVAIAALKHCEYLVEVATNFHWKASKQYAYEPPPPDERLKWGIRWP